MRIIAAAFLLVSAPAWQATVPDLARDGLANGPYARMHFLYERTIFNIDVLTVEMRFDEATQRRFRQIASGRGYTDDLAERIAVTAVHAENVFVEVRFERDVRLDRSVGGVGKNLGKAHRWGVIDRETQQRVGDQLSPAGQRHCRLNAASSGRTIAPRFATRRTKAVQDAVLQ